MMREHLLRLLSQAPGPLTPSELQSELERLDQKTELGAIIQQLRGMGDEGWVRLEGMRWRLLKLPPLPAAGPRNGPVPTPRVTAASGAAANSGQHTGIVTSRWGLFRRLCRYYMDCLLQEDAPQLRSYVDNENDTWVKVPHVPWDRLAGEEAFSLTLSLDQAAFNRQRARRGTDDALFLGYPLIFVKPPGNTGFLVPIFAQPLQADWNGQTLSLVPDGPIAVNGAWLEYRFRQRAERESFLRAMGFISEVSDEDDDNEVKAPGPYNLGRLAEKAAAYIHDTDRYAQPVIPLQLNSSVDWGKSKPGLYNAAILALGPRLRYTKSLMSELKTLAEDVPDDQLDQTVLADLFPHEKVNSRQQNDSAHAPEQALPQRWSQNRIAHPRLLHSSQRSALASALSAPVSVITGPPGTGKSEVVACILLNELLRGRTALFASRNHQALEAVVPRLNNEVEGGDLIVQASSRELAQRQDYLRKLRTLLARPPRQDAPEGERTLSLLAEAFERQEQALSAVANRTKARDAYESLRSQLQDLRKGLPIHLHKEDELKQWPKEVEASSLASRRQALQRLLTPPRSWIGRLFRRIMRGSFEKNRGEAYSAFLSLPNPYPARSMPTAESPLEVWMDFLGAWESWAKASALMGRIDECERELRAMPAAEVTTTTLTQSQVDIEKLTRKWMSWASGGLPGAISPTERESLANLRAGIENWGESRFRRELRSRFPLILQAFPLWSVSNLSAKSTLPLVPGLFDLVVIDEASQCDIPSVVPLLARSRRVAFVGDPQQLKHVSRLDQSVEQTLLQQHDLTELSVQRFSHRVNSAFDLGDINPGVPATSRILLDMHFRSHEHIADYCNEAFYSKSLHVVTESERLQIPRGKKPGICWTDVKGSINPGPTGAWCPEEIDAIAAELQSLAALDYRGTIGVVTPFVQQMNRLKDTLESGNRLPRDFKERVRLLAATVNGFQGGERDLMLFSLCGGPDMPTGAGIFLKENRNLFNVAVSRARAVLHIVGNRDWALASGLDYLKKLAQKTLPQSTEVLPNNWAQHQSPWEERFSAALRDAGIPTAPQYPIAGRFLDLAVLSPRKIDIEVDGESVHRTAGGGRKDDDHWRDLQLKSLGWEVERFWVYQLRENMPDCVARIKDRLNTRRDSSQG